MSNKKKVISLSIDIDKLNKIDQISDDFNTPRSVFLRRLLYLGIDAFLRDRTHISPNKKRNYSLLHSLMNAIIYNKVTISNDDIVFFPLE